MRLPNIIKDPPPSNRGRVFFVWKKTYSGGNTAINTIDTKANTLLTLYALAWRIRHDRPKFIFKNKKGSSKKKKNSMTVATMSR